MGVQVVLRKMVLAAAALMIVAVPAVALAQEAGTAARAGEEQTTGVLKSAIPTNLAEAAVAMGMFFLVSFVICSIVAVWFVIERMVVLRRGRVIPRHFVDRFIENLEQGMLDPEKALSLCEENGSPIASVFAHGIRKWGKPSVEVEQAIIDGGERQVSQLRSHLRILNGVATVAPLLGLQGTVVGMIQGFNQLANASDGKESQLAAAIAVALITTATGLFIAIPTLVAYMYLAGRVDALVMEMDRLSQDVVHLISAEALADKSLSPARIRNRRSASPSGSESKERKAV